MSLWLFRTFRDSIESSSLGSVSSGWVVNKTWDSVVDNKGGRGSRIPGIILKISTELSELVRVCKWKLKNVPIGNNFLNTSVLGARTREVRDRVELE